MTCTRPAAVIVAVLFIAAPSAALAESAIGQLETLTNQTIDRSIPQPTYYPSRPSTYVKKITPPKARPTVSRPSSSDMAAMNALSTGLMVLSILNAMDTADAAEAEAARAMAEAERQRLAEEQRQQRIISADRLRTFWDGRDREMAQSLDDVFSVPGQGQGTAFFGSPANPAVIPSDPGTGHVEGVTLETGLDTATAPILGTGAPEVVRPSMVRAPEPLACETSPLQEGIMESGQDHARVVARDTVKKIAKKVLKSMLPSHARNIELMAGYTERMEDFTGNLFGTLEPQRLVGTLKNGGPGDYQAIMNELDGAAMQGTELGLGDNPFSNTMLETGFKLLKGHYKSADATEVVKSEWKGFVSDQLQERLTSGWM
ncbi:MAG: hypothetical protein WAR22_02020 [Desulfomonilia bacterium]|jgi:hypothetical protein